MHFDNGMLGLCISVCAVMGMVLSGFALAVDTYERTVIEYDYVTDISGLFDYSDEPTFIDFNPSDNWTGYYTSTPGEFDGVEYTTTADNRANNYPINLPATETPGTITLSSTWQQMTPPYQGGEYPRTWGIVYAATGNIFDYTAADDPAGEYTMNPNVTALSTVVDNISTGEADRIRFDLSGDAVAVFSEQADWRYQRLFIGSGPITTHDTYTLNYTDDISYLMLDLESAVARAYGSDGIEVWAAQSSDVAVAYNGESDGGNATVLSSSLPYTLIEDPPTIYMDISAGVGVIGSASWTNDYHNGRVDVLFRVPDGGRSYAESITVPLADIFGEPTGSTLIFDVNVMTSGNVAVVMSCGGQQATISLGDWRNFILSMDAEHGTYKVVPVSDFVSFTTYSEAGNGQTFDIDIDGRQSINDITFTSSGSDPLMQGVVETTTFLGTYDAVMVDPEIDISDYYTETSDLRLNFYSFALYGDSITINGTEYEVDEDARINIPETVDGKRVDRMFTLTNVYITYEGSHTSITFVNDGVTMDLGETETTAISMDGVWYFTTGLYEGRTGTETAYEWDFSDYIYDSNMSIVAFLGFLGIGTIVGARLVRGSMSVLDYIVVGFAALCALTLVVI